MNTESWRSFSLIALLSVGIFSCWGSLGVAVYFDGGTANPGDWNDATNWTDDLGGDLLPGTYPGPTIENAIIGQVPDALILSANPATVFLNTASASPGDIGELRIGNLPGGDGTFNHSSGAITSTNNWSYIAAYGTGTNPSVGTYNMSGDASFTQSIAEFHIGIGGRTDPNTPKDIAGGEQRNEGTLNLSGNAVFTGDIVFVGSDDENKGNVKQTGGTFNANSWVSIAREKNAIGVYNMSGGSLNVTIDGITVGQESGTDGSFDLSNDAAVDSSRLRLGRYDSGVDPAAQGSMSVTGHQVIVDVDHLDIGSDDGTLTNGEGTLTFTSSATGISTLDVSTAVTLNDGSVAGFADLVVDLSAGVGLPSDIVLIDVGETGTVFGSFRNLPEGATDPSFGGRMITYAYGPDGNDIALVPSSAVNGDYDDSGQVGQTDLDLVLLNWGAAVPPTPTNPVPWVNQIPTDGQVNQDDLDGVLLNWGNSLAAASIGAAPEPSSVLLMLLGGCCVARRARSQR